MAVLTVDLLIKAVEGKFVLSSAGRRRVDGLLPMLDTASHDQAAYGEAGKAMSQFYARSKRRT